MMIKIDFVSDLHFEINGSAMELKFPQTRGDYMVLVGDMLPYRMLHNQNEALDEFINFIRTECRDYKKVFWVPGNHEYYRHQFSDVGINDIIPKILDEHVLLVNNKWTILGTTPVYFGTLWTDMDRGNPLIIEAVQRSMNDYRIIYKDPKHKHPIRGTDTIKVFEEQLKMCEMHSGCAGCLCDYVRPVIFTHHGPSLQSHNTERYGKNDPIMYGYLSDLDERILGYQNPPSHWIHGHTHSSVDYMIGDTRILGSMYGYVGRDRMFREVLEVGQIEVK